MPFTPSVTSGLIRQYIPHDMGYSADASMDTWYDDSATAYDATQGTSGKRCVFKTNLAGGKGGARFDGTDDEINLGDLSALTEGEVFIIVKNASSGTYQGGLWTGGYEHLYPNAPNTNIFEDWGLAGDRRQLDVPNALHDAFRLHNVSAKSSEWVCRQDGTVALSLTSGFSVGFPSNFIIAKAGVSADFLPCDVLGILVYDRVTNSTERGNLKDDFADYFELTNLGYTPPDATPPSDVTGLTGSAASATQVNLDWDNATDADTGIADYRVYYNTSNSHTGESYVDVGSNTSAKNVTGLTPGTASYYFWVKAKNGAGLYSDNYSSAHSVATPPRIDTNSPLNNAVIGVAFSQTLGKTGQSGTWSIQSGAPSGMTINSSTGEITWSNPTPLGTVSDIVVRFTQSTGGLYAEKTFSITVGELDFSPFEILDHCKMLNINGLGWGAPLIEANFGGGYGAGIIANQDYGLHRWQIASEFLPDKTDFQITATIDGESETQNYFTYVFEFFKRHTLRGNKPFIIKEARTGLYYLVRFAMQGNIDFGRLTAKFFTSEGIAVEEARTLIDGFTFADDGSVTNA